MLPPQPAVHLGVLRLQTAPYRSVAVRQEKRVLPVASWRFGFELETQRGQECSCEERRLGKIRSCLVPLFSARKGAEPQSPCNPDVPGPARGMLFTGQGAPPKRSGTQGYPRPICGCSDTWLPSCSCCGDRGTVLGRRPRRRRCCFLTLKGDLWRNRRAQRTALCRLLWETCR